MFDKILIANRGEIACRVMRTARRMGIATVAVYSQADTDALHVRMADEALCIGPAPAAQSYLLCERILQAARSTGAQAVHPGYGFLSENADFAMECERQGLVFIGPPPSAIRAMGSKSAAKALMQQAGVPLTPGYHGAEQDADFLAAQARSIGYPVLIKASAGGGGKGMRRVDAEEDFAASLASCRREALAAFGDDQVLIEKYILEPRHIEIQVFGDTHGNQVYLFERDCSVQRRHQKVLEEAPAPGMDAGRRAAMGRAALEAARAVGYVGAGTVEFIVTQDGSFYFMEMNTRLQVEHPVTEMITGLDLVEWQLRVAAGEPLALRQEQLSLRGHAIEARIYAEDPQRGFLPSTGRLLYLAPPSGDGVRVDTGVEQGDRISPHYDPMIAKLIVHGEDRRQALARMRQALARYRIAGVASNVEFLSRLVASPSFAQARLDTGLIEREHDYLFAAPQPPQQDIWLLVALAELLREQRLRREAAARSSHPASPWALGDGWRLNGQARRSLELRWADETQQVQVEVQVQGLADGYQLCLGDACVHAAGALAADGMLQARLGERSVHAVVLADAAERLLYFGGRSWRLALVDSLHAADAAEENAAGLRAPMPGRVVALLVEPGAEVAKGTPLLLLEAMKMEHTISAPRDGVVEAFHCSVGEQVPEGAELLALRGVEA